MYPLTFWCYGWENCGASWCIHGDDLVDVGKYVGIVYQEVHGTEHVCDHGHPDDVAHPRVDDKDAVHHQGLDEALDVHDTYPVKGPAINRKDHCQVLLLAV